MEVCARNHMPHMVKAEFSAAWHGKEVVDGADHTSQTTGASKIYEQRKK